MKLAVIGGGPGGYVAAIRAAQLGAEVVLIEKEKLGGTCLNVGCIPTKSLLHSAELAEELTSRGSQLGVIAENISIDFKQVMANKEAVTKKLTGGVGSLLKMNKVKVIEGTAEFSGVRKLSVKKADGSTETVTADKVIIAAGSINAKLNIDGIESEGVIDSTEALSLENPPKSMVVIGGGVIGLEMACAYSGFGTKVTVVEAMPQMLPMFDDEVSKVGIDHLKKNGVEFNLNCKVQSIEKAGDECRVKCLTADGKSVEFQGEKVLIAVGRRANTEGLKLEAGGIKHDRGKVIVNEKMETSVQGVYAIGDCVLGYAQLAHAASAMGEVAAENACGHESKYSQKTCPSCIYISPELASVGLTEKQCKEEGIEYKVGIFPMSANGKALIANDGEGLVKVVAGKKYGEILGMQIAGPRASDLISEGALAISLEATCDEIIDTIHSHPTISEAIREAVLNVEKRAIHTKN